MSWSAVRFFHSSQPLVLRGRSEIVDVEVFRNQVKSDVRGNELVVELRCDL